MMPRRSEDERRRVTGNLGPRLAPVLPPFGEHGAQHALDVAMIEGVAFTDPAAVDQAADDKLVARFQLEDADTVALARAMACLTGTGSGTACGRGEHAPQCLARS